MSATKPRQKSISVKDPAHLDYIRSLPCTVGTTHGCFGRIVAHHDPTKGAGGHDRAVVPLCWLHHSEIHTIGRKSFDKKYGVNLRKLGPILSERNKAA